MNKKYLILIIILVVLFGGLFIYFNWSDSSFSDSKITVPNGFVITKQNNTEIIISNDKTNYSIIELSKDKDISFYIKERISHYDDNNTIINQSSKFAGIPVESIILKNNNNNKTIHVYYYYEKNNKKYQLFSKGEYNKTALDLIVNSTI